MFNLKGRTALVTGAGQNIGAGIARALSKQGAHVLVNDLIVERSNKVVSEITGAGGTASGVTFDVTDLDEVIAAIKAYGPVDIVVQRVGKILQKERRDSWQSVEKEQRKKLEKGS